MNNCSWCNGRDEHEEFCNECNFCQVNICCECWDSNETCYFPGEGYCPSCKKKLHECPKCLAYISGMMREPEAPICKEHWN